MGILFGKKQLATSTKRKRGHVGHEKYLLMISWLGGRPSYMAAERRGASLQDRTEADPAVLHCNQNLDGDEYVEPRRRVGLSGLAHSIKIEE